jgi:hypothetical protein
MPFSINLYGIRDGDEVMLTWDHLLPKSLGGSNRMENAQCMCFTCNNHKRNRLTLKELIEVAAGPLERFNTFLHDKRLSIFDTIHDAATASFCSSTAKAWSWNWR